MKNEKGEVITVIMVLMMVGMMVFGGMALMHESRSDHGNHQKHEMKEHQQPETSQGHVRSSETGTTSTPAEKEGNK